MHLAAGKVFIAMTNYHALDFMKRKDHGHMNVDSEFTSGTSSGSCVVSRVKDSLWKHDILQAILFSLLKTKYVAQRNSKATLKVNKTN